MSKKSTVFKVTESFTIRKINFKNIAEKFFNGEYNNRSLPEKKIKNGLLKFGKDVGNDLSSEVYRFKDKNNNNQTIYTTNHALYEHAMKTFSGKDSEKPILKCKYCKRLILKTAVGLPVSMEINGDHVSFHVVDNFCDFGCTFSHLKRKLSDSRPYRGPLYENAEQLLYSLYYRIYPDRIGKNIKSKDDWDLLRENGGSLTDEEFDSEASEYFSIPTVTLFPSKNQYIKVIHK